MGKRKILYVILVVISIVCFTIGLSACSDTSSDNTSGTESGSSSSDIDNSSSEEEQYETAVTSVSLNNTSLSLTIGDSITLTATIQPSDATNQNITWKSSDITVATVYDGVVTSLATGTAIITVTTEDGNFTASCIITVAGASATIISVNNAAINGKDIYLLVDYTTSGILLSDAVTCSANCSWKLYSSDGITEIPTKMITSLEDGNNTYYIVVTSIDDASVSTTYILTIYKSFAVKVTYYTLTYYGYESKTKTAYTGYSYTADYIPDLTGYTFNYWKTSYGQEYSDTILWGNLSLYADITANTYAVTYDADEGTISDTETIVTYSSDYILAVPERTGYTFNGWYYGMQQLTNENGESLSVWNYVDNITVTAKWTANNYTVTLNRADNAAGTVTGSGEHIYDSGVTIKATTNDGYTWVGWYNSDDELVTTEVSYTFTMGLDVTYTAKWTYYTVTTSVNDKNAGSVTSYSNVKVTAGKEVTIAANSNDGYTWFGWYNGGIRITIDLNYTFTMPAENLTLTAKWTETTVTVSPSDDSAGTVSGIIAADNILGNSVTVTATEVKLGYIWLGWYCGNTKLTESYSYTLTITENINNYIAMYEVDSAMANFEFTSTYTTCTITGIKDNTVTEITVPDYVTAISGGAFSGCSSLVSITLPFVGGNKDATTISASTDFGYIFGTQSYTGGTVTWQNYGTYYIPATLTDAVINGGNILDYSFVGCTSLKRITLPDTATSIGRGAFSDCISLVSVTIPNSVTSIGSYAFSCCRSLVITIPDSVTSIGSYAFIDCTSLTSVTIGSGVTIIGDYAFYDCTSLVSVTISDSVTSIGAGAFIYCTSLESIVIADSVTSIGAGVFSGCGSLVSITLPFVGGNKDTATASSITDFGYIFGTTSYTGGIKTSQRYGTYYIPATLTDVTINGGEILCDVFSNCTIKYLTIGSKVTSISSNAFSSSYIANITILEGLTTIDVDVFFNSFYLESITIPDSVKTIGDCAFSCCTSLTSVTIGSGVTSIGSDAFGCCPSLTCITVSSGNTAYKSIDGNLYSYDGKTLIQYAIGKTDTSFTIPNGVEAIGDKAFSYCTSLTSVTIGSGVTTIGDYAFSDCTSLTSITIPNSVTFIGRYAFSEGTPLSSVTFANTSGWYISTSSSATSGTDVDVSDISVNAIYLTDTYCKYYWYRSEN